MSEVDLPVSFQAPRGVGDEADVQRLSMVLDLQANLAGVRRLRSWARDALAPHPGQRAIDIGSGTGEELQALASGVGPSGEAIGIEPNAGLRAEAERRAAGSTARFIDGSAYDLPFDQSTVDLVRCERVFQHLAEPERAAAEIARVLRPGGRAVVIDSDWATAILHPGDQAVVQSLYRFWLDRFPNPFSGRRLAGQLNAAGLTVTDIGSQALIQDAGTIDTMLGMMGTVAIEAGIITQPQLSQLLADLTTAAARGDFHSSVTMFAVLARVVVP